MKYIIFDLEATCWKDDRSRQNETIEIGAVGLDEQGQSLGEFQQFIRPRLNTELSPFCNELTSITQQEVDEAPEFPEAIRKFREWIGESPYVLCSWGFYDRKQFRQDCSLHEMNTEWIDPHISVKHQHRNLAKVERAMGLGSALKLEGFKFMGTPHRGIDDARNIVSIFKKYFGSWEIEKK